VVNQHTVGDLFSKGATLQFLQPQRFEGRLWRLLSALEAQMGCLVGRGAPEAGLGAGLGAGLCAALGCASG
jgi:hypothetical protein